MRITYDEGQEVNESNQTQTQHKRKLALMLKSGI